MNNDYNAGFDAYNFGEGVECTRGKSAEFDRGFWAAHDEASAEYFCDEPCLDEFQGDCGGIVEYRPAMSPTGRSFPRCEAHFAKRLDNQERIVRTYGGQMFY